MTWLTILRMGVPAVAGAALMWLVYAQYNALIGHPRVANEARQGYVVLAEKTALEAQLAEERRLRTAAELARIGFARLLEDAQRRQAEDAERIEQEITQNEALLENAGRSCRLDDADVEWLRKP